MHYDKITFWANKRRSSFLTEFKLHIIDYFKNTNMSEFGFVNDNETAQKKRKLINEDIYQAQKFIHLSGIDTTYNVLPAPNQSICGKINILHHIFELRSTGISDKYIIDIIERAIGVYKNDLTRAYWRTFNPLHWLLVVVDMIVKFPYQILQRAGFDANRIENSKFGKVFKVIEYIIVVTSGFLSILYYFGIKF